MNINRIIAEYETLRDGVELCNDEKKKAVFSMEMAKLHNEVADFFMEEIYSYIDREDAAYQRCRAAFTNILTIINAIGGNNWVMKVYDFHIAIYGSCDNDVTIKIRIGTDSDIGEVGMDVEASYLQDVSQSVDEQAAAPTSETPLHPEIERLSNILKAEPESRIEGSFHMEFSYQMINKKIKIS